jgi:hypothetical protein
MSRRDLAHYLEERISNPMAERYLLDLFQEEGACATFCRELELRMRPRLQRRVLGWGEISQVAEVYGAPFPCWRHPETGAAMAVVYKKMPPFLERADAEAFVQRYFEYNSVLRDEIGIAVPAFDARIRETAAGQVIIFVVQERLDPESVGHKLLVDIGPLAAEHLYRLILAEYEKLFVYNQARSADGYLVGLDGQIPNWAVDGYGGNPDGLTGREKLVYLDTNVPMIRIGGQDVVSTDMYFQALPGSARWLIKKLNLDQEVMDRYFHIRAVILDFLGNTIVRHRADLVPRFIEMSNKALAGPFAAGEYEPFTMEEVQRYYRSDVATWRLWRSLKLIGVISDAVSRGEWRALGWLGRFYRIWTEPIF